MKNRPLCNQRGASGVELMLVFTLVVLFGVTMITLVLSGGDVYQRIVERKQAEGDARIAVSYVNVLLRRSDRAGAVRLQDIPQSDRPALALTFAGDHGDYLHWVYFKDGALWSTLTGADELPAHDLAEKVIEIEDYRIEWDEARGLLRQTATYTAGGRRKSLGMSVMLRAAGGGDLP